MSSPWEDVDDTIADARDGPTDDDNDSDSSSGPPEDDNDFDAGASDPESRLDEITPSPNPGIDSPTDMADDDDDRDDSSSSGPPEDDNEQPNFPAPDITPPSARGNESRLDDQQPSDDPGVESPTDMAPEDFPAPDRRGPSERDRQERIADANPGIEEEDIADTEVVEDETGRGRIEAELTDEARIERTQEQLREERERQRLEADVDAVGALDRFEIEDLEFTATESGVEAEPSEEALEEEAVERVARRDDRFDEDDLIAEAGSNGVDVRVTDETREDVAREEAAEELGVDPEDVSIDAEGDEITATADIEPEPTREERFLDTVTFGAASAAEDAEEDLLGDPETRGERLQDAVLGGVPSVSVSTEVDPDAPFTEEGGAQVQVDAEVDPGVFGGLTDPGDLEAEDFIPDSIEASAAIADVFADRPEAATALVRQAGEGVDPVEEVDEIDVNQTDPSDLVPPSVQVAGGVVSERETIAALGEQAGREAVGETITTATDAAATARNPEELEPDVVNAAETVAENPEVAEAAAEGTRESVNDELDELADEATSVGEEVTEIERGDLFGPAGTGVIEAAESPELTEAVGRAVVGDAISSTTEASEAAREADVEDVTPPAVDLAETVLENPQAGEVAAEEAGQSVNDDLEEVGANIEEAQGLEAGPRSNDAVSGAAAVAAATRRTPVPAGRVARGIGVGIATLGVAAALAESGELERGDDPEEIEEVEIGGPALGSEIDIDDVGEGVDSSEIDIDDIAEESGVDPEELTDEGGGIGVPTDEADLTVDTTQVAAGTRVEEEEDAEDEDDEEEEDDEDDEEGVGIPEELLPDEEVEIGEEVEDPTEDEVIEVPDPLQRPEEELSEEEYQELIEEDDAVAEDDAFPDDTFADESFDQDTDDSESGGITEDIAEQLDDEIEDFDLNDTGGDADDLTAPAAFDDTEDIPDADDVLEDIEAIDAGADAGVEAESVAVEDVLADTFVGTDSGLAESTAVGETTALGETTVVPESVAPQTDVVEATQATPEREIDTRVPLPDIDADDGEDIFRDVEFEQSRLVRDLPDPFDGDYGFEDDVADDAGIDPDSVL